MNSHENFRGDIEGLRGVAVVLVILFHLKIPPFSGGFIGVDVFFVISGFLITRIVRRDIEGGKFSFARFCLWRVNRLYPALIFCLIVTFVLGFVFVSPMHFSGLSESLVFSFFGVSNFLYLSESGYFDLDSYLKPLLHTWSLSVEWQFYLVWPPLVYVLCFARKFIAPAVLACVVVFLDCRSCSTDCHPYRSVEADPTC